MIVDLNDGIWEFIIFFWVCLKMSLMKTFLMFKKKKSCVCGLKQAISLKLGLHIYKMGVVFMPFCRWEDWGSERWHECPGLTASHYQNPNLAGPKPQLSPPCFPVVAVLGSCHLWSVCVYACVTSGSLWGQPETRPKVESVFFLEWAQWTLDVLWVSCSSHIGPQSTLP